jgi:hypothetical protein
MRRKQSLRSALAWSALSATVLAAVGAVATLAWRRYRDAMAADSEPDTVAQPQGDAATASEAAQGDTTPPADDESSTAEPRPATSSR